MSNKVYISSHHSSKGFTIVELLIVVVVIAILAAITIVAYNGITERAKNSSVQSAAQQAFKKLKTHSVTNNDQYPVSLASIGIIDSGDITYGYYYNNSVSPATFCVTATSGTINYYASSTAGSASAGTCPSIDPVVASVGTATSTSTSTTIAVTTTATIPVNDVIAVALSKMSASSTAGSAVVSLGAGAVSGWTSASAQRSGVTETEILVARVTTAIPSGTTVTVTTSTANTNRAAMAVASITNMSTATPNATSGDDAQGVSSASSAGANASATSLAIPTDAATTVSPTLVLIAAGFNISATWTFATATQIAYLTTSAGSSDRGLMFGWKLAASNGVQSETVNGSTSTAVSGAILAIPY